MLEPVDPLRIVKLARELKKRSPPVEDASALPADADSLVDSTESSAAVEASEGESEAVGGESSAVGRVRSDGGGGLAERVLWSVAESVPRRRRRDQLDGVAESLFVVRPDSGFHPCVVVRVRGGDGGPSVRRGMVGLRAVDRVWVGRVDAVIEELVVKQFNYRVKGSEKFWTEEGAEEMLQLRADLLSSNQPLVAFLARREANESGQHRYRMAA